MIESNTPLPPPDPWGSRTVEEEKTIAVRLGPRDLWLRGQDGEVWISHSSHRGTDDPSSARAGRPEREPPPGSDWSRWAPPAGEREVGLVPRLPDRPVVLQPERSFTLLPGAEARIYVRVPLWIGIELRRAGATSGEAMTLLELPSAELSDTWWGGLEDGELCYWLTTTARREMRDALLAPHLAVCPVFMVNRSSEELRVEKLAFRVPHLSLFATGSGLWADTARVLYRGDEEGSQIEMSGQPPDEVKGAARVASPREPAARGLRARTFMKLKEIPGMGGIW